MVNPNNSVEMNEQTNKHKMKNKPKARRDILEGL